MAEKLVTNTDEENSLTMLDVLQEESQLEEDAYAVLGASDDRNCTYNKYRVLKNTPHYRSPRLQGYIRQALYACKTCCAQKNIRAGVCLACSFHCHEGHELVELYTKRNFKCDCGNSKFGSKVCNLEKSKLATNIENKYNQNFDGVYCICARPYPDPENENNDVMLQCVLCEDWYHSKHLECKDIPGDDAYEELVCAGCMKKHDFLWRYAAKYSIIQKSDVLSENGEKLLDVESIPKGCTMPAKSQEAQTGSCFWLEGWRTFLCNCESCKKMYQEQDILFLLDPKDSVQAYEEAGKITKRESQYEKGMKALASLDHIQQMTAIEEYNNLKERLKEYLEKFAKNKKVVREEDIKEFFSEMESKKRPKIVIPTYCR